MASRGSLLSSQLAPELGELASLVRRAPLALLQSTPVQAEVTLVLWSCYSAVADWLAVTMTSHPTHTTHTTDSNPHKDKFSQVDCWAVNQKYINAALNDWC